MRPGDLGIRPDEPDEPAAPNRAGRRALGGGSRRLLSSPGLMLAMVLSLCAPASAHLDGALANTRASSTRTAALGFAPLLPSLKPLGDHAVDSR